MSLFDFHGTISFSYPVLLHSPSLRFQSTSCTEKPHHIGLRSIMVFSFGPVNRCYDAENATSATALPRCDVLPLAGAVVSNEC